MKFMHANRECKLFQSRITSPVLKFCIPHTLVTLKFIMRRTKYTIQTSSNYSALFIHYQQMWHCKLKFRDMAEIFDRIFWVYPKYSDWRKNMAKMSISLVIIAKNNDFLALFSFFNAIFWITFLFAHFFSIWLKPWSSPVFLYLDQFLFRSNCQIFGKKSYFFLFLTTKASRSFGLWFLWDTTYCGHFVS